MDRVMSHCRAKATALTMEFNAAFCLNLENPLTFHRSTSPPTVWTWLRTRNLLLSNRDTSRFWLPAVRQELQTRQATGTLQAVVAVPLPSGLPRPTIH